LRDPFPLHHARIGLGIVALVLTLAASASSSSSGPQPGSTGVPAGAGSAAEPTCTSCHTGFPLNSDGRGRLTLSGVPARYVPGERYTLVLELRHPDEERKRWGFQLTAVSAKTLSGAGAFVVTDNPNTQLIRGTVMNREYVSHSYYGTGAGEAGGQRWSFDWTAPKPAVGRVAFYGVGSAADLDGSEKGDRIYGPAPKPLAITDPERPGRRKPP
jgi:hypothetical protein